VQNDDKAATAQWVEPRRHQLRHGREQPVLTEIAALKVPRGAAGEGVQRAQNDFATHGRTHELPDDPTAQLADWLRPGGVSVSAKTVPL